MPECRPRSSNHEAGEDDSTEHARARNDQRQSRKELDRSGQETKRGTETHSIELVDHKAGACKARTSGCKRRGTRQRLQDVDPGALHEKSPYVLGIHRGSERSYNRAEFKKDRSTIINNEYLRSLAVKSGPT